MKFPLLLLVLGALGWSASLLFGESRSNASDERAQTTYYASGQLESKIEYEDGKREGPAERWHPSGAKLAQGQYADGRMEGEWKFWSADGTLDAERSGIYRQGDKIEGEIKQGN